MNETSSPTDKKAKARRSRWGVKKQENKAKRKRVSFVKRTNEEPLLQHTRWRSHTKSLQGIQKAKSFLEGLQTVGALRPPPVGGLNRVYLEAGTRVLKLLDMLSRRYAVVTSRTRWMTFPGNEPSAYAYEHVHRSCQLSEYSHQTFRLRYNQMRWVESR